MLARWSQFALFSAAMLSSGAGPGLRLAAAEPGTAGTILGIVSDPGGVAQMGATVSLFNHLEKLVSRTITNERGQFGFDNVVPDSYSIRVTLSTFVPAVRTGILIQPGMRSFLNINLASVLSSVQFVYATPNSPRLLSDDWRWVLRSSMSTRPVLRLLPTAKPSETIFTNTRGVVRVSAGDGGPSAGGSQPDLGTAFAVATSLYGVNQVQVSGNVGYASRAGMPTAGFRTRFSRDTLQNGLPAASSPEVQLTVRQMFLPMRAGALLNGGSAPSLGSMTGLVMDRTKIGDDIEVLYGAQLETVTFIERLNILSPFARIDIDLGHATAFRAGWASGAAPEELYASAVSGEEFQQDLSSLSAFPRVSMRGGHAHVQRVNQAEASVSHQVSPDTKVNVAAYWENVANAALAAMGDTATYATGDMMPDPFSRSSVFNIGSYQRRGAMATVEHRFGDSLQAQVGFGTGGTLQPRDQVVAAGDALSLRSALRRTQRSWASMRISGTLPGSGTRLTGSYMLTDYRAALPLHRHMTLRNSADPGLNVQVRQPIPGFGIWSGRVEAVAELRNMLQQGYLPFQSSTGRRVVLVPSPRTVRGGLAFIF